MNQPKLPSSVHGPMSMSCIWPAVHHHPAPARANSRATSARRARAAANAGARPPRSGACGCAVTVKRSGGPRERGRESRLSVVLDAERTDLRPRRLGGCELGANRVEDPCQARRLARLDAERHDVLDLEVDRVPDPHAVAEPLLDDLDRCTLDAEHLADERSESCHRPALLSAED